VGVFTLANCGMPQTSGDQAFFQGFRILCLSDEIKKSGGWPKRPEHPRLCGVAGERLDPSTGDLKKLSSRPEDPPSQLLR